MTEEQKLQVELEVRRVLAQQELEVRRSMSDELEKQRKFLQSQFRTIVGGLSVLFIAVGGLFTYMFGNSYTETRNEMLQQVDHKVIEYGIVDSYRDQLQKHISEIMKGRDVTAQITRMVNDTVSFYVDENLAGIVEKKVEDEMSRLGRDDVNSFSTMLKKQRNDITNHEQQIKEIMAGMQRNEVVISRMAYDLRNEIMRSRAPVTR